MDKDTNSGHIVAYERMPYAWPDRAVCIAAFYDVLAQAYVDKRDFDVFCEGILVYVLACGETDVPARTVRVNPYASDSFVSIYFRQTDDEYVFTGAVFPRDPTIDIALGATTRISARDGFMALPVTALGDASDIAAAIRGTSGTLRWPQEECYVFFCNTPDFECRRASESEIALAVRHRMALYNLLEHGLTHSITRERLDMVCSTATKRHSVVDWLTVFTLALCFAKLYDRFLSNELALFRRRMEMQVTSPGERICLLAYNRLDQEYLTAYANTASTEFVSWTCARYADTLESLRGVVAAIVRDADSFAMPENLERVIARAVHEIAAALSV